jgi:catalase
MKTNFRIESLVPSLLALAGASGGALAATPTPPATAVPATTPAGMVDALHSAFGEHRARAVHAKGVMLEGRFTPTSDATQICACRLFEQSVPVVVRFSDFTGIPDIPDAADGANPRGLALKFTLGDGQTVDVVSHSFNGFPVATADEFAVLLRDIGASGPGVAKPTPLDQFLDHHPIARRFLTTQKPAPVSYATLTYFGVNAFTFTNAAGVKTPVRYRFVPHAGERFLEPGAIPSQPPNYLADEIATRVATGPVDFDWFAQVAGPGDAIADPSIAWPENRRLVKLGTVRVTRLLADGPAADRATMFLPGNVPAGIEPADPMVQVRTASYPISFRLRQ